MKTPEAYLSSLLGDLQTVTLLGQTVDLYDMVRIAPTDDLEDLLRNHPLLAITWERLKDKCAARLSRLNDDLDALRSQLFVQYYSVHEDEERKELDRAVFDEDMFLPEDKRKAMAARISRGDKAPGRWRRNFSDALINHFVGSDPKFAEVEALVRAARNELNLAESIVRVLEHRRWCLTHLAGMYRDMSR